MRQQADASADLNPEDKRALLARLLQRNRGPKIAPLSFAQQRLWFLNQLAPGSPFYNVPAVLRLDGQIRPDLLEASLREIVRRHEVLRTTFGMRDGQPVQVIAPEVELRLRLVDLQSLGEAEREAGVARMAHDAAREPFDLAQGPLLRSMLIQLEAEHYVLLLTMHHIVCDGWSMGVLFHELSVVYAALVRGAASPLAPLPI